MALKLFFVGSWIKDVSNTLQQMQQKDDKMMEQWIDLTDAAWLIADSMSCYFF